MSLPRLNAVDSPEQWIIIGRSGVAVSAPADTSEDVLATIVVPANAMGPNGALRISTQWTFTSNANTKTPRIRFGGIGGSIFGQNGVGNTTDGSFITRIHNRGATNSQGGGSLILLAAAASSQGPFTSALDTLLAQLIVITAQKAVGGDAATLESYLVELLQGA